MTSSLAHVTTVLFDIDGTLARGANAHHACMAHAARSHGFDLVFAHQGETVTANGHPVTGWLDAQVFRACALPHELTEAELASLMTTYCEEYEATTQFLGTLVPGAAQTLDLLAQSGIAVALATGNAHRVARRKLAAMGVDHHFTFAPHLGFGDMHADRTAMVRAAMGTGVRPECVAVVGDTPYDMAAAAAVGAAGVGVLTGSADEATLFAAGASFVMVSVAELGVLLTGASQVGPGLSQG